MYPSPASRIFSFTDPVPYGKAIRAAQVEVVVAAKGDFRAELTQIDLPRLWMQRGRENLPRVFHSAMSPRRAPIVFLTDANQPVMHHSGVSISPGEVIFVGRGATHHHRSFGPARWGAMSLTPDDLAAAGRALAGRDLAAPATTKVGRPPSALMARLRALHEEAAQIAKEAPDLLAHLEVARGLEQALVHTMIMCLTEGTSVEKSPGSRRHSAVVARLEDVFAANPDRPLYLLELCAATGVSERTLRACCQEHLGMGPVHYLWLRRMHLAHHALMLADPATATVTEIATEHGFWELGRFAVEYRALFGEQPSASLRRPPDGRRRVADRPFALPVSESA